MCDQGNSELKEVEFVRYRSPRYLLSLGVSLFGIGLGSIAIFAMLANIATATTEILIGLCFTIMWMVNGVNFLFTIVKETETREDGLRMKCFPRRYRFFPWTDIDKLVRRGTDVIIHHKGPVIFRRAYILASYSSQLDMIHSGPDEITRLITVICQQAGLSPKRKTLWGYHVYIRDDGT